MADIGVLKKSRFITRADVKTHQLFTITGHEEMNAAPEGNPRDMRWVLHFRESEKPFVLNSTNGSILAGYIGSTEMGDWNGHQVVLFDDPNISFGGKLVGGIRVRQPKTKTGTPAPAPIIPPPAPAPAAEGNDEEVPF